MYRVFIDGREGTTGLRIAQRLQEREDIELIRLPDDMRKDPESRRRALNGCDAAILCLPDAAAIEAAGMVENPDVVVIDASTAHRTNPDWAYGFPELSEKAMERAKASKRIAVPGCHASGFIALVYPLVEAGLLPSDALLSFHSLTGYSGGGKRMIAEYAQADGLDAPRAYALGQAHKHLPEMRRFSGLEHAPLFLPVVGNFYSGMLVTVPMRGDIEAVRRVYVKKYAGPVVEYREHLSEDGFLSAALLAGRDSMRISVEGSADRMQLIAAYDNLGKGASGAAVEILNIKMGADIAAGLVL